jgi:lysine/ornithine N-monooxygenase
LKERENQMTRCDVAIVGAGPYGLSAAAHLQTVKGLGVRVFGDPMSFWRSKMPAGMLLRSPREASSISDPRSEFTLDRYEEASGTKPVQRVALETFVDYGRWFQAPLDSILDRREVTEIRRDGPVFKLALSDGAVVASQRVVIAAGIGPFKKSPAVFSDLPCSVVSHCYDGRNFTELRGKRVAVIGAGQSALESAALLQEAGAQAEVIARISTLRWIGMHIWLHKLGPISRILYSKYDVGPIGVSRLVAYPKLMFHIPLGLKDRIRTRAVRSAGAPWLVPRLPGVKMTTGRTVQTAKQIDGEIQLVLDDGSARTVDHVLLGTGYRVDISRYGFLSQELVKEIHQLDGYPALGPGFGTTVPGLHFIGATAARNYGPLLYFVAGTDFASRELTSYITRNRA